MRFVAPETVRIELPGGQDWIVVKKELTAGEERKFRSAGLMKVSHQGKDPEIGVNWADMAFARVEAYLVDWSAQKPDGTRLPVSRTQIEALHTEDFEAIDAAVQAHIAASAEEKKVTPTRPSLTVV